MEDQVKKAKVIKKILRTIHKTEININFIFCGMHNKYNVINKALGNKNTKTRICFFQLNNGRALHSYRRANFLFITLLELRTHWQVENEDF